MARSESLSSTRRTGNEVVEGNGTRIPSPHLPPRDESDDTVLSPRHDLDLAAHGIGGVCRRPEQHRLMAGSGGAAVVRQWIAVGFERIVADPDDDVDVRGFGARREVTKPARAVELPPRVVHTPWPLGGYRVHLCVSTCGLTAALDVRRRGEVQQRTVWQPSRRDGRTVREG